MFFDDEDERRGVEQAGDDYDQQNTDIELNVCVYVQSTSNANMH